jgi:hypothetical protein
LTCTIQLFQDVLQKSGVAGVVILAAYVAVGVGAVAWLGGSIVLATLRWLRCWSIRRELRVLRGGREPMFTAYGDFVERPPRLPVRSLRARPGLDRCGDDTDAA